ncbi:MAG: hypothetical protein AVO35_08500 [Candidatus Aegiribacteria sp. MLS_C]|nr:MAG: hypothetical protein AVO35_08500 [Candidatus Aegiribacteria sp. MLS_C]
MKVIVTSAGPDIESPVSGVFGRAPYFLEVDTEDLSCSPLKNPALEQGSGAGIEAAQFVLKRKPDALISSNYGPNAFQVLTAGSIPCYEAGTGTVRESVEAFSRGELEALGSANAASHSGVAGGGGRGGGGRGGGGRGSRNMDRDRSNDQTTGNGDRVKSGGQLEELSARLRDLRGQIADIVAQIDRLTEQGQ